jgi:hypothetical protein
MRAALGVDELAAAFGAQYLASVAAFKQPSDETSWSVGEYIRQVQTHRVDPLDPKPAVCYSYPPGELSLHATWAGGSMEMMEHHQFRPIPPIEQLSAADISRSELTAHKIGYQGQYLGLPFHSHGPGEPEGELSVSVANDLIYSSPRLCQS